MRARKSPFLLRGIKMKRVLSIFFSFFTLVSFNSYSMDAPLTTPEAAIPAPAPQETTTVKPKHVCSAACVEANCKFEHKKAIPRYKQLTPEEKAAKEKEMEEKAQLTLTNHRSVMEALSIKLKEKFKIANAETEVITEHTSSITVSPVVPKAALVSAVTPTTGIKKPNLIPLSTCSVNLLDVITRGSKIVTALSKPDASDALCNNLEVICQEFAPKNNEFINRFKDSTATEKNEPDYLRLIDMVTRSITAADNRSKKEPFASYLDDVTHSYSSFISELGLLNRTITKK